MLAVSVAIYQFDKQSFSLGRTPFMSFQTTSHNNIFAKNDTKIVTISCDFSSQICRDCTF